MYILKGNIMSVQAIYASKTIGLTDLRTSSKAIKNIDEPIAILSRDTVQAYLISPTLMERVVDYFEDLKLGREVDRLIATEWHTAQEININDI